MRKRKQLVMVAASLATAVALSACGGDDEGTSPDENTDTDTGSEENMDDMDGMDHDMDHDMDHSSSGEIPEDLEEAEDPTYEVGSQAMIEDGHMEGMAGAEATIVGAYDTTAYAISYTPTTGGERVENHKWIIHEEVQDAADEPYEPGAEVMVEATHMEGMEGARAEIDSTEETTVYMIDFTSTTSEEEVINHKWVTESELSSIES
ncbi:YdhK family protein [Shouchella shacheensis]|uniref:YdhK family protein n=1 Tax=Shouchella shacheensis TaxID=1649580 RepID=UPI00074031B6|nr:YdhK family protein [Shouchella shacheensis]